MTTSMCFGPATAIERRDEVGDDIGFAVERAEDRVSWAGRRIGKAREQRAQMRSRKEAQQNRGCKERDRGGADAGPGKIRRDINAVGDCARDQREGENLDVMEGAFGGARLVGSMKAFARGLKVSRAD